MTRLDHNSDTETALAEATGNDLLASDRMPTTCATSPQHGREIGVNNHVPVL